jgi:uncharacterized protein YjbI with pentapeptide repeats
LAHEFASEKVQFVDVPDTANPSATGKVEVVWVVFPHSQSHEFQSSKDVLHLAPWSEDECIEYLLAVNKERCASVMARLRADRERDMLQGNPQLWRIVLDQMAAHASARNVREALDDFLDGLLTTREMRAVAAKAGRSLAVAGCLGPKFTESLTPPELETWEQNQQALSRVLRHRPIQLLLAVSQILRDIQQELPCKYFQRQFARDLVQALGATVAQCAEVQLRLKSWFEPSSVLFGTRLPERHAMAASILHAAGIGWVPKPGTNPMLAGAYLQNAAWPEIALSKAVLDGADLSCANLWKANLPDAQAVKTDLSHAGLRKALLPKLMAPGANLSHADLSQSKILLGRFTDANLEAADFRGADLRETTFIRTNLAGASFCGADLRQAIFGNVELDRADFSAANLQGVVLAGAKLCEAIFEDAKLHGARLKGCDLEDMNLPGVDFSKADLSEANLTGASMRGANFNGANLHGAYLAEIDWEGADLRDADLRCASFHMGSSRSGLVGSPIACEGSRTGFYTDDFNEQDFKSPEEIRKANLCRADLRGAKINDVDFYLVDLRHALIDPEQEAHLRRCGAILEGQEIE